MRTRRGGLFLPLVLIGIGVVFLLSNLGLVDWNVWDALLRLWPLLLVALGLDLILGRGWVRGLVVFVVVAIVLVGVAALVFEFGGPGGGFAERAISEPLRSATSGEVELAFGAGHLAVSASQDPALFVEGEILVRENEDVQPGFSLSSGDNVAHFSLESKAWFPRIGSAGQKTWSLRLNRVVPISLQVSAGAGEADLDLSEINLTALDVRGGVGQMTATLPAHGRFTVQIRGGVGRVVVLVPAGLGVRVVATGGLGAVQVPSSYSRDGHVYTSPDYAAAENTADISVRGGVGQVAILPI